MRSTIRSTLALLVFVTLGAATAGPAVADRSDCKPRLERDYRVSYAKVRSVHGVRAPGRNIRKNGVLFRKVVFDTTCAELRRSLRQLHRLLTAPRYPTLVRSSVPPPQPPAGVRSAGVGPGGTLQSIAQCESGGNYSTNTGNGYYGAYQFDLQTWQSVGGSGLPSNASPAEQDYRAARLYAERGASPWPVCGQ